MISKAMQKQVSKELAHVLEPNTNFYHYYLDAINETSLHHSCCMSMPSTNTQQEHHIPLTAPNGMHIFFKMLQEAAINTWTCHIPQVWDIPLSSKILSVLTLITF